MKAKLPAVLTVTEEANKPRRFTLDGMLKAKKTKIELWDKNAIGADIELLGLKGSPTIVKKVFPPPGRKQGEAFDGTHDPHAAAKWLVQKLTAVNAFGASPSKSAEPTAQAADQSSVNMASGNPGKFGEVWVWVEHFHGKPSEVSWELLGEGKRLARIYGTKLAALVIGNNVSHLAKEAIAYGADKVYVIENKALEDYRTQPYAVGHGTGCERAWTGSFADWRNYQGQRFGRFRSHSPADRFDSGLHRAGC